MYVPQHTVFHCICRKILSPGSAHPLGPSYEKVITEKMIGAIVHQPCTNWDSYEADCNRILRREDLKQFPKYRIEIVSELNTENSSKKIIDLTEDKS